MLPTYLMIPIVRLSPGLIYRSPSPSRSDPGLITQRVSKGTPLVGLCDKSPKSKLSP